MIRTTGRMRLCCTLIALNLLFIWGNSCLPASASGAISGKISDFLAALLGGAPSASQGGHHILRKLAHFSEFALLGIWLSWLLGMLGKPMPEAFLIPVLLGLLCACCDETIQLFVDGRASSLIDVWIDTGGALLGTLAVDSIKCKRRKL